MKYFDCWLRPIDKKEYARIQQRKELYEKAMQTPDVTQSFSY